MQVGVHTKPTALARPLGISSMHPVDTHLAWPGGLVHRACTLTSSTKLRKQELQRLHIFFAEAFGSNYAEEVLQQVAKRNSHSAPSHCKVSYLVIPYFRDFDVYRGLRKVLREFSQQTVHGAVRSLRLSFKNRGTHLHHTFERHRDTGSLRNYGMLFN